MGAGNGLLPEHCTLHTVAGTTMVQVHRTRMRKLFLSFSPFLFPPRFAPWLLPVQTHVAPGCTPHHTCTQSKQCKHRHAREQGQEELA